VTFSDRREEMGRATDNKLILVIRRTRLDDLIARFNSEHQARFYIEHLGADFSDYVREHQCYYAAVSRCQAILATLGRVQIVQREFLPTFMFNSDDYVVVLGQDGLVANTLKYLSGQPVIGVNPDPTRWDGVLLPFEVDDLETVLPSVFRGGRPHRTVTMAKAVLNDGQVLYAVNDLFIGPKTHTSARYSITVGEKSENHSSSGIIVSTGLGSTGWLRSILAGAAGVSTFLGNSFNPPFDPVPWDSGDLIFTVREPFLSKTTSASLVFGMLTPESPMIVTSFMPENGVIFSDGIETDYLAFSSGTRATITVAEKKGTLVV